MITTALASPEKPGPLTTPEEFVEFTEAWLNNRRLSDHTRAAYRRDVHTFLAWCFDRGLAPLTARFTHVNEYARWLEAAPQPKTGKPLAPATVARKLTGLSSWYSFLAKMDLIGGNPCAGADRPFVDRDHSTTVGMTPQEVDALLLAAHADSPRAYALLCLLADLGVRVSEALSITIADLGIEQGFRTVRFVGKGGKRHHRRLSPGVGNAMNTYLLHRADSAGVETTDLSGPLFVTATGKPVDRQSVHKVIRRLAKQAGIASADSLSAHSLRHAYVTNLLDMGVAVQKVQHSVRHADTRTTLRYKQNKDNLAEDPSYDIWMARAQRGGLAA
jgi:integrase/recombinase XerD